MLAADAPDVLRPGTIVAKKYRVERILGRGATGVVVAAKHLDLGHEVAIKIVLPAVFLDDRAALERFLREGRVAARLSSPHVARVYDVGYLEGDIPYLVMELVRGRNLAEVLAAEGPQPVSRVAGWCRDLADVLGEAHALGIVHRDVKPANVMLSETLNGKTIVKLVDFGISKLGEDAGFKKLTDARAILGSPAYMAPEQIEAHGSIDGRADIWALGVVAYELTTGQLPFDGPTLHALAMAIVVGPAVPPSQHVPALPTAFDTVVTKCLQKAPEHRFASMEEFADAVSALIAEDGSPRAGRSHVLASTAHRSPAPERAWSGAAPRKRLAWFVALGARVGLLLALVTSLAWWRLRSPDATMVDAGAAGLDVAPATGAAPLRAATAGAAPVATVDAGPTTPDATSTTATTRGTSRPPKPAVSKPNSGSTKPSMY